MKYRTKQGLQTLRRAHQFLTGRTYVASLGELTPHIEALGELVDQLQAHATEQGHREQQARGATDDKRAKGVLLRQEFLRPIAAMATTLFVNDTNIRSGFRIPRGRDDEGLLKLAESFIERAAEYESRFVARGLAPDFVQRLRAATAAFRDAIDGRGHMRGRRAAATVGMHATLREARALIRLIDLMLVPRLAQQPDQLAEWRSVSRFARRGVVVRDVGEEGELGSDGAGSGVGAAGATGGGVGVTSAPITFGTPVAPISSATSTLTPPSGGSTLEVKAA